MSLTARIALSPSRAVAIAERVVPPSGLAIAAATIAARFPDAAAWTWTAALLAAAGFAARTIAAGSRARFVLSVSDRPDVEVAGCAAIDGSWRLAESTVSWPGFAMLALERDDRRALRVPVAPAALAPTDRRAFARFLAWAMRARIESRRSAG